MKFFVYAVFDSKAGIHMQPWLAANKGVATRAFGDQLKNPESPFSKHPEDYILYELGTFEQSIGFFENHARAENLGSASQWVG